MSTEGVRGEGGGPVGWPPQTARSSSARGLTCPGGPVLRHIQLLPWKFLGRWHKRSKGDRESDRVPEKQNNPLELI